MVLGEGRPSPQRGWPRGSHTESPGHGKEGTPITELSMQDYADRVVRTVDEQAEPVILVRHSLGGIVVSLVAEARTDRVRKLVYLTGFLLEDGNAPLRRGERRGGHCSPEPCAERRRKLVHHAERQGRILRLLLRRGRGAGRASPRPQACLSLHDADQRYRRQLRSRAACVHRVCSRSGDRHNGSEEDARKVAM